MCGNMVDIQSATAEIRRGKNEETERKKEKRNHRAKIECPHLPRRVVITSVCSLPRALDDDVINRYVQN